MATKAVLGQAGGRAAASYLAWGLARNGAELLSARLVTPDADPSSVKYQYTKSALSAGFLAAAQMVVGVAVNPVIKGLANANIMPVDATKVFPDGTPDAALHRQNFKNRQELYETYGDALLDTSFAGSAAIHGFGSDSMSDNNLAEQIAFRANVSGTGGLFTGLTQGIAKLSDSAHYEYTNPNGTVEKIPLFEVQSKKSIGERISTDVATEGKKLWAQHGGNPGVLGGAANFAKNYMGEVVRNGTALFFMGIFNHGSAQRAHPKEESIGTPGVTGSSPGDLAANSAVQSGVLGGSLTLGNFSQFKRGLGARNGNPATGLRPAVERPAIYESTKRETAQLKHSISRIFRASDSSPTERLVRLTRLPSYIARIPAHAIIDTLNVPQRLMTASPPIDNRLPTIPESEEEGLESAEADAPEGTAESLEQAADGRRSGDFSRRSIDQSAGPSTPSARGRARQSVEMIPQPTIPEESPTSGRT